jgi:hypothetical protein
MILLCNSSVQSVSALERRKATPLPQATVAHRSGDFYKGATVKRIPLSRKGHFALVDDAHYDYLSTIRWNPAFSGETQIYARAMIRRQPIYMHDLIYPSFHSIDHIDRNGLNNQMSNLRVCTNSQNSANRRKISGTTSKYRGVTWHKACRKWQVQLTCLSVGYYVGLFDSEEEAGFEYNKKALELWGEFANLNNI